MGLKQSYTILAPVYDAIVASATDAMRRDSLRSLSPQDGDRILLAGVGTGLDLPHLPAAAEYYAMDLTAAMLIRARQRLTPTQNVFLHRANVMHMPYPDNSFDGAVLHLILAVVAEPQRVLAEASRVVKPGGRIHILDKFLRPGQRAPARRMINMLIRHIATRTDVVFEDVLPHAPQLRVISDEPCLAGGWFRRIQLQKHSEA
ncbi:MAG: methyltransferase domain-containing protein [Gammaproteobacteria bacterium]|jgi:phosphatidylethanolamine/phosphatidyl-N-methylethanolamine N-methyltransferase